MPVIWLAVVALAGEADAEAARIRSEIGTHATRSQWDGVERNLEALAELESPMDAGSLLHGASSAEARGDLALCRERLQASATAGGDRAVIDPWIGRIDAGYGRVVIVGEGLIIEAQPFTPTDRAIVARADTVLGESGRFEGWLPPGRYLVGGTWLEVVAGQAAELDTTLKRKRSIREVLGAVEPTP